MKKLLTGIFLALIIGIGIIGYTQSIDNTNEVDNPSDHTMTFIS